MDHPLPKLSEINTLSPAERDVVRANLLASASTDPDRQLHELAVALELDGVGSDDSRAILRARMAHLHAGSLPPEHLIETLILCAGHCALDPSNHEAAAVYASVRMVMGVHAEQYAHLSLRAERLLLTLGPAPGHPLAELLQDLAVCDLEQDVSLDELLDLSAISNKPPRTTAALAGGLRLETDERPASGPSSRRRTVWLVTGALLAAALFLAVPRLYPPGDMMRHRIPEQAQPEVTSGSVPKGAAPTKVSSDKAPPLGELVWETDGTGRVQLLLTKEPQFMGSMQGQRVRVRWIGGVDGTQLCLYYETSDGDLHPFMTNDGTPLTLKRGDDAVELQFDAEDVALVPLVAWDDGVNEAVQALVGGSPLPDRAASARLEFSE